jgi:hypothetical protein
MDCY